MDAGEGVISPSFSTISRATVQGGAVVMLIAVVSGGCTAPFAGETGAIACIGVGVVRLVFEATAGAGMVASFLPVL